MRILDTVSDSFKFDSTNKLNHIYLYSALHYTLWVHPKMHTPKMIHIARKVEHRTSNTKDKSDVTCRPSMVTKLTSIKPNNLGLQV